MQRDYVLQSFQRPVDLKIDYAAELNEQQLAAVTASPGPSLVLAGAGSGKTRTLTYRVAYLLEHGVPAERILLLTFTNKAAKEMMRRVSDLVATELAALWGGTFHSIGARILRSNAAVLGYRPEFTILDREDSETLLKACLGDLKEEGTSVVLPKVEVIADLISRAANERQTITRTVGKRQETWVKVAPILEQLARSYAARKRAANVMDFDDLLVLWLQLLEQHEEVRERYQRRFQWVLVDEYQDTNQIQSDLIDLLVAGHQNVMAVGDDSQSIYSWRGANFRNILDFPRRYANARLFKVEVNYRSTPEILAVANAAIAANTEQFAKSLTPARRAGMKPVFVPCEDGHQQAAFVAQRITELHEEGVSLPEIAILYRSHFHALEVQLELTRRGIPFVITSGIRFFEQAHIKDVTAWLKWVVNPDDELSFKRLVQLLPGVGPKAADKLWSAFGEAYRQRTPAADGSPVALAPLLIALRDKTPKKTASAWANFATTVAQIQDPEVAQRGGAIIQTVVEAFYEEYAGATFPNAESRLDDLEQLANYAGQFQSLTEFLTQLSLLNNMEAEAEQKDSARDDDRVRLSTVHQAKGLEFQVVFVIMLAEGLFPSGRSLESPIAAEEERRLFYVAVTRAKDELYLCCPLMRATPGMGLSLLQRSRFLAEIPEELLDRLNLRPANRWNSADTLDAASSSEDQGDAPF
ncbi:MAG: ATP-dependent helicase [Verrucomicrobiales bacterium]|nr:ATP-dependent helicase [Verrucomicrobiales bacterium]